MSKEIKEQRRDNLEKEVMLKITSGSIVMKPKWYFVLGSTFLMLGTAAAVVGATFLINLTIFLVRKNGLGYGKLLMMFSNFPFWIPIMAILGIVVGIFFLKKYDFSYRKNFKLIVIGFVASIVVAGLLIDKLGLNDIWSKGKAMKIFYQRVEGVSGPRSTKGNGLRGGF